MSAVDLPQSSEEKFETAIDTLRTAQEGDEVLFGNRKQPLTVMDTGGTPGEDRYIVVRGPKGGTYTIREEYSPDGSVPQFNTDNGQLNANNLRPAGDLDVGQRFPTDMLPNGGSDGSDDGEPGESAEREETPGVEAGETGTQDGDNGREHDWQSFDIDRGEGEWVVSGQHDTLGGKFTAVYFWDAQEAGWRLDQDASTIGQNLDQSDRARLVQMIEDELEAAGETVIRTGGDIDVPAVPEQRESVDIQDVDDAPDFDPNVPGGEAKTGDEFVYDVSGDPMSDFDDLKEAADVPESEDIEGVFSNIFGSDPDATWTFIDELLDGGRDVPKSVNNWHLVDYGVITDENVDSLRKAAWYNTDTDALVGLVGVKDDEGEATWYVYHTTSLGSITSAERSPKARAESVDKALDEVERILFDGDEEADMLVKEDPATDDVTVIDTLSNSEVAQRLAAASSFDPFNIRSYIAQSDAPSFIQDLDAALVRLYDIVTGTASRTGGAIADFVRGAEVPTPGSVRSFLLGLDFEQMGAQAKATLIMSVQGIRRRYGGFAISPTIDYDEFGVTVGYYFSPDASRRRRRRETIKFKFRSEPAAHVVDTVLPSALGYSHLVFAADALDMNEAVFSVPGQDDIALGQVDSSTSGPVVTDADELASQAGLSPTKTLLNPRTLRGDRLRRVLNDIEGREKAKYVAYVAMVDEFVYNIFPGKQESTIMQMADNGNFRGNAGEARLAEGIAEPVADALSASGQAVDNRTFIRDEFSLDAIMAMIDRVLEQNMTVADGVADVLRDSDEWDTMEIEAEKVLDAEPLDDSDKYTLSKSREPSDDDGSDTDGEGGGGDGDGGQDGSDDGSDRPEPLSEDEEQRAARLLQELGDSIEYDDLPASEKNLLSRVNEEADILTPRDVTKLQEIRESTSQSTREQSPETEVGTQEMVQKARDEGLINSVERMEQESREDLAGAFYDDPDRPPR